MQPGIEYRTMGVRWYGKGAYDRGAVTTETVKAKSLFRAHLGDFVFNRIDTQNGAFDVVSPDLDGALATNEFPLYITDPSRLLAPFLLLYFQQESVRAEIDRTRAGSEGRARWKEADFEGWQIPLPPLAEQRRIVDLVASVDNQIASISLETIKARRVLSALRADVPTAGERLLSDVIDGIDSGRSALTAGILPRPGRPRVLKLSAVQLGVFDADEAKELDELDGYSSIHLIHEGDLLVTRSNTPGRVGYVAVARDVPAQTYLPDLIWRVRPDEGVITTDYLGHVLSSPEWRARITSLATGTSASMQKINKKNFGTVKIPVPSLDEQADYVTRCDVAAVVVRSLLAEAEALRSARSALLAGLLARAIEIPESYDRLLEEVA